MERAAAALLEGGAGILQFRHKDHWSRGVFNAAREIARMCREAGALLIVDDRADMAMLLEAGLHVGQDDLQPRDARRLMGADTVIGLSSHNAPQACAAGGEPVSYVAFGPVFPTASKRNADAATGIEIVKECRALVDKPLVAIGGITRETARAVLAAVPEIEVDYLELRGADLGPLQADRPGRLLIAARLGNTRLLDNIAIAGTVGPDESAQSPWRN